MPKQHQQTKEKLLFLNSTKIKVTTSQHWGEVSAMQIVFQIWVTRASNPVRVFPNTPLHYQDDLSPAVLKAFISRSGLMPKKLILPWLDSLQFILMTQKVTNLTGLFSLTAESTFENCNSKPAQLFGSPVSTSHSRPPPFSLFCVFWRPSSSYKNTKVDLKMKVNYPILKTALKFGSLSSFRFWLFSAPKHSLCPGFIQNLCQVLTWPKTRQEMHPESITSALVSSTS